jgi:hypothetical protein
MHDLDRTQLESEQYEHYEVAGEQGEEFLGGVLNALTGSGELESGLHETQEMELASELLEVQSEEELEQFLGNLLNAAARAAGQFARSDTGRALGGILKNAAQQALPVVGRAIGERVPIVGGDIGATLAQRAGSLLGLELEGLSPQDQEFESARQFVRFGAAAARHAARAPYNVSPRTAARAAAVAAAHRHAPGLVRVIGGSYRRPAQRRRPYGYGGYGSRRPYGGYRRPRGRGWYGGPTGVYGYDEPDGDDGYEPEHEPYGSVEEPGYGDEEPYGDGDYGMAGAGAGRAAAAGPTGGGYGNGGGARRNGRWVRSHRTIVIYGA